MNEQSPYPFDLVAMPPTEWQRDHRRAQLEAFGKLCHVLIVDRPADIVAYPPRRWRRLREWLSPRTRVTREDGNVSRVRPFCLVPDALAWPHSLLRRVNAPLLRPQMRAARRSLGTEKLPRVLWLFKPQQLGYIGTADETLVVYDCYDNYSFYHRSPAAQERVRVIERGMLERADIVIAATPQIYEPFQRWGGKVHLVPDGVDYDFYSQASGQAGPVSPRVSHIKGPIIGYLGTVDPWSDFELLLRLAQRRPQWSLVLVGPDRLGRNDNRERRQFQHLVSLANVHHLGWVDSSELHSVCRSFDVALVPYETDSPRHRYTMPSKLLQYLAMGKPIVSTDLPGSRYLAQRAPSIRVAESHAEYEEAIEQSLQHINPQAIEQGRELAREHSWSRRSKILADIVMERLERL